MYKEKRTLTDGFVKVMKSIESCVTHKQLNTCVVMSNQLDRQARFVKNSFIKYANCIEFHEVFSETVMTYQQNELHRMVLEMETRIRETKSN